MADCNERESSNEKHKKERKDFQAKIQKMKHGIPKGDKKKKKEIMDQINILEAELQARHDKEMDELTSSSLQETTENLITQMLTDCSVSDLQSAQSQSETVVHRVTKAQKRRNKKAVKAKEREQSISQQEEENLSGARHIETMKLNDILSSRNLSIHEVPSDGDCLYRSIAHQMLYLNQQVKSVAELRKDTSNYMLEHKEDFIPFLTSPTTGDTMTTEEYENYCTDIATQPMWGGQIEIIALSHVYSTPIEVIQADGPSMIIGENYQPRKLILSYHRHIYGLGEHYNSVIEKTADTSDKDF